ncbi:hypothetical protein [Pseudomonas sp. NFACC09-4]
MRALWTRRSSISTRSRTARKPRCGKCPWST